TLTCAERDALPRPAKDHVRPSHRSEFELDAAAAQAEERNYRRFLECANPVFQTLSLGRDDFGLVKRMGEQRYSLRCGEQMDGQPARVGPLAQCLELHLNP